MKKLVFLLLIIVVFICLIILVITSLLKYLKAGNSNDNKNVSNKSLGEKIREYRNHNNMSQEFVAEAKLNF